MNTNKLLLALLCLGLLALAALADAQGAPHRHRLD
jgi:hypothetical protein